MSEIDWSKAPEGATHYSNLSGMFYKFSDNSAGRFWSYDLREWLKSGAIKDYESMVMRPSPVWSGDGLPPVGVVCQWFSPIYGWLGGKVVGHDGTLTVIAHNDGYTGCHPHEVRPIRTPEQIAADEREAAIDQIISAYEYKEGQCTHKLMRDQAARFYDAGLYRKP